MNKITREEQQKWSQLTDVFQYGTLGLLFITMFILNSLTKEQAKIVVWYFAGVLFVLANVGFIIGLKSANKTKAYFTQEFEEKK